MRVKLDENLPRAARERLIALGWDVHDVHEEGLAGAIGVCLEAAVRALRDQSIRAALWIVEPERLRIRDHPTGV